MKRKKHFITGMKFSLPSHIQGVIETRWFYLYKWVGIEEMKIAIERDFLYILSRLWVPLVIVTIFWIIISIYYLWYNSNMLFASFLPIWITLLGVFIYLIGISIYRSFLLSRNAFVLLTEKNIYIDGKVIDINNIDWIKQVTYRIENVFHKKLFSKSGKHSSVYWLYRKISDELLSSFDRWWAKVGSLWWPTEISLLTMLLILIYVLYVIIMFITYFFWILLLFLFLFIVSLGVKKIVTFQWRALISMNNFFNKLEEKSAVLTHYAFKLQENFIHAKNNNWQESLLMKINSSIDDMGIEIEELIDDSIVLREKMELSDYRDIFQFSVYDDRLKNYIFRPVYGIKSLIDENLKLLLQRRKYFLEQIWHTSEASLQRELKVQATRLDNQMQQFSKSLELIKYYLSKGI